MKPHYKPIPTIESNLFKVVMQESHKEFEYPWHYHPEYELTYILTSHGVRYVGKHGWGAVNLKRYINFLILHIKD